MLDPLHTGLNLSKNWNYFMYSSRNLYTKILIFGKELLGPDHKSRELRSEVGLVSNEMYVNFVFYTYIGAVHKRRHQFFETFDPPPFVIIFTK